MTSGGRSPEEHSPSHGVVRFKPSEKTPAVGQALVTAFHEAGVPAGVVQLLIGARDEGEGVREGAAPRKSCVSYIFVVFFLLYGSY